MNRILMAIQRIREVPIRYPFRFVMIGDTGAAPHPAGDANFAQLRSQIRKLNPRPLFVVNLGDFAGPGTLSRHEVYSRWIDELEIPSISVIGNHDLDEWPIGYDNYRRFYGEENFYFDYGNTRFLVIYSAHCKGSPGVTGPRCQDLEFLENRLKGDNHPNKIVFMHMPPYLDGHYAPHPEWGFRTKEKDFLRTVEKHNVKMVVCAHVLAYDHYSHSHVHYVVSGGGGYGICSHYGLCQGAKMGTPPSRGSFYHFVLITVNESGKITGNVIKIHEGTTPDHDYDFTIP